MSIKCKKSGRSHDSDEEHRKERNVRKKKGKGEGEYGRGGNERNREGLWPN